MRLLRPHRRHEHGVIAIMLGRLRMSVPEAIKEYAHLIESVFSERKLKFQRGAFKASKLESAITDVVLKYSTSSSDDGRMLDPRHQNDVCKTFVCAVPGSSMVAPILFRTYPARDNASVNCFIWEAARATCAAPLLFKRFTMDHNGVMEDYIDSGRTCLNPQSQVAKEAGRIFTQPITYFVSLGTGHAELVGSQHPGGFWRLLPCSRILIAGSLGVASCDAEAESAERQYWRTPGVYFRFDVDQGLQQVSVAEWDKLPEVTQHTKQYLKKVKISQKVDVLVQIIRAQSRCTMDLY